MEDYKRGLLFANHGDLEEEAGTAIPTATESLANSSVYKELLDDDGTVRLLEPDEPKPVKQKSEAS